MEARRRLQPSLHRRMFVGAVVVDDQMNIQRRLPVDLLQEAQPFDMGMPGLDAADELAWVGEE